jgi:predicted exporter
VLLVALHQWSLWRAPPFETDVLALLPRDEHAPDVEQATRRLAEPAARQLVAMVGAADWAQARLAAAAWRSALEQGGAGLVRVDAPVEDAPRAVARWTPWRDRLLTAAQRERLGNASPHELARSALAALSGPAAAPRLADWASDPLALWPQWWSERAAPTHARPRDGALALDADGLAWVVMPYATDRPAFAFDGTQRLAQALHAARAAASAAVPGARVVAAGVPLHVEASAARAHAEVNTIGWGSLAAVILLAWLAFRSARAIALVALSLAVGLATALSATAWAFGSVHLLTVVFGASLVGVAEDYGIHWFAARQGHPGLAPHALMRRLLPALAVALITSALGYAVLGAAPFPGLRQMAVFSAVGLAAAFATVWLWFPLLDRRAVAPTPFACRVAATLESWPRWSPSRGALAAGAAALAVVAAGLARLDAGDDVRQLQGAPGPYAHDQREAGRLLGLASPAQFFIVRGDSAEQVLEREEALVQRLAPLVRDGVLAGWRATSDWVPSPARQLENARLVARAEGAVIAAVNAALGESIVRPAFADVPLALEQARDMAVSPADRALWLGDVGGAQAGIVMLRGLRDAPAAARVADAARGLEGVRWVDRTADTSGLLGRYRASMTGLLVLGHALVLLALACRYRAAAWRAWLPTALASLAALATLGWLGQPVQLFHVLALALLLGVGIDYGVFLLEHRGDGSAWTAVVLGAASTGLAFGLLALSHTPALRAFGFTLLVGLGVVAVLAPALRATPALLHPSRM